MLDGATVITTTGTGAITFTSTLGSAASEDNTLTLTGGTGNVVFTGAVGAGENLELGAVSIVSAVNVTASSTIEAASLVQTAGTGTTTLTDNVTTTAAAGVNITAANINLDGLTIAASGDGVARFNGATVLDGATVITTTGTGAVTFTSTVDGAQTLSVDAATGDATFAGDVGATTALTSLTVTGSNISLQDVTTTGVQSYTGATTFNSTYTTSNAAFTVTGGVTLGSATTVNTGGGAVGFTSTIDSQAGEANDLTIASSGGDVTFNDALGGTVALGALDINSGSGGIIRLGAGGTTGSADSEVSVTGEIVITGALRSDDKFTVTTTGGGIDIKTSATSTDAEAKSGDSEPAIGQNFFSAAGAIFITGLDVIDLALQGNNGTIEGSIDGASGQTAADSIILSNSIGNIFTFNGLAVGGDPETAAAARGVSSFEAPTLTTTPPDVEPAGQAFTVDIGDGLEGDGEGEGEGKAGSDSQGQEAPEPVMVFTRTASN